MADITEIRELAQKLNLWNIARGYIDLNDEKLRLSSYSGKHLYAIMFTFILILKTP
jgi:hypothetical protein